MNLIGIDIGGTKISVCLGDETGKVKNTHRIETPKTADSGVSEVFSLIEKLLEECSIQKNDITAIGISCPGPISVEKGVILDPPNLKGWHNFELVKAFENKYQKPIFLNNDANAAAVAEWEFGNLKKANTLVYLTLSTGMGGGLIVNSKLVQGKTDTAGEVGHFIVDINGPVCSCGLKGCFEAYCGGANVANRVKEKIEAQNISTQITKEAQSIDKIDMRAIIEAVKKNDPFALNIWEEFVTRCAQGIGTIIMTLNPNAIVLGTIAIHTKSLFLEPLMKKLPLFCWKVPLEHCKIEPSILGSGISELSSLALAIYGLQEKS